MKTLANTAQQTADTAQSTANSKLATATHTTHLNRFNKVETWLWNNRTKLQNNQATTLYAR